MLKQVRDEEELLLAMEISNREQQPEIKLVEEELSHGVVRPCFPSTKQSSGTNSHADDEEAKLESNAAREALLELEGRAYHAWPLRANVREGIVPTWPELLISLTVPCTDDEVATEWLNNEAVREAINAKPKNVAGDWELCTDRIKFHHDAGSMMKYHRNLTLKGYRALIFSGDHDMCVPFTGSEAWTRAMGYKIFDKWRPWISNGEVAGYTQGYENNLTFLTIKGAGHTVPEYKPKEALNFYSRFLAGKAI
ncbi:unnamed protein product [Linum trigynum]|uniref:Uncharacterized protein n=1 Tax=Linum trigynum TaxID=586398 RepID=A0AAV2GNJ5_9ROSI